MSDTKKSGSGGSSQDKSSSRSPGPLEEIVQVAVGTAVGATLGVASGVATGLAGGNSKK